jgi:MFS family permease
MIALQVSVFIAAPFFTPYMLGPLRLSYVEYTILTAAVFGARVAVFPLLGRLAHRFGARFLLNLGGLGVAPLAVLWLVSDAFAYLLVLQLLAGVVWGAYELATMLLFFETMPRSERLSLLTFFNVANAVALVFGSLLGGALLGVLGESPNAYAALFAISSALRIASALLLLRLSGRRVPVRPVATRTVAVRPGLGALQRPVLSSALGRRTSVSG